METFGGMCALSRTYVVCLWVAVHYVLLLSHCLIAFCFKHFALCCVPVRQTNTYRKGSQKHNYICNIQGVSVYTNVSANYMFRLLLVRPSSGWIPWSEEMYNSAI